jgi:hypothetical protein
MPSDHSCLVADAVTVRDVCGALVDTAIGQEQAALFPDPSDDARFREATLDALPSDTARAVRELDSYEWQSPEAAQTFEQDVRCGTGADVTDDSTHSDLFLSLIDSGHRFATCCHQLFRFGLGGGFGDQPDDRLVERQAQRSPSLGRCRTDKPRLGTLAGRCHNSRTSAWLAAPK